MDYKVMVVVQENYDPEKVKQPDFGLVNLPHNSPLKRVLVDDYIVM